MAQNPYRGHTTRRELLLASGNEKASNHNCLTKAIIYELDELQGSPCTISSLHSSLLQNQPEHGLKPTPIFTCMAGASAGISLVPIPDPATSETSDGESVISPKADLARLTSPCRVLISVALTGTGGQSMEKVWMDWLANAPPNVSGISISMEQIIKSEAVYVGNSYHMIFSVPVSVWNSMTPHPAINFISFIRSDNLISTEDSDLSDDRSAIQLRLEELLGKSSHMNLNRTQNHDLRTRISILEQELALACEAEFERQAQEFITPLQLTNPLHGTLGADQSFVELPITPEISLDYADAVPIREPNRLIRPTIAPSEFIGDEEIPSQTISPSLEDRGRAAQIEGQSSTASVISSSWLTLADLRSSLNMGFSERLKGKGKAKDQGGATTHGEPVQYSSSSTTNVSVPSSLPM